MRLYDTGDTVNTASTVSIMDIMDTGDIMDAVEFGRLWCEMQRNTLSRSGVEIYNFNLTSTPVLLRVSGQWGE